MLRFLKRLRIVWTAVCGVTVLLTLVLWGRSYFRGDNLTLKPKWGLVKIASAHGVVWYNQSKPTSKFGITRLERLVQAIHASDTDEPYWAEVVNANQRWYWLKNPRRWFLKPEFERVSPGQFILTAPYWLPVLVGCSLAAVPWIRWSHRFSLRTLLIATTIAAIGLTVFVLSR